MVSSLCAVCVIENYVAGLEVAKISMGNILPCSNAISVKFGAWRRRMDEFEPNRIHKVPFLFFVSFVKIKN